MGARVPYDELEQFSQAGMQRVDETHNRLRLTLQGVRRMSPVP